MSVKVQLFLSLYMDFVFTEKCISDVVHSELFLFGKKGDHG